MPPLNEINVQINAIMIDKTTSATISLTQKLNFLYRSSIIELL